MDEVLAATAELGYPVVVARRSRWAAAARASPRRGALHRIAGGGLIASPTTEVLLEESILGWKEYELELMRDRNDNVVVICSIENVDPMGVHTGDSVTVAPALTLTDREYQTMRDLAIAIIRAVGVDTGGCNIQFAGQPRRRPDRRHRDEPAGVAVLGAGVQGDRLPDRQDRRRLAIGYTLDEIPNDITRETPSAFEPSLDYVVVKIPRFAFEKFPAPTAS
jgi:carbamoyl-phosphate synthase large subunit